MFKYPRKIPLFYKILLPSAITKIQVEEKKIFLSFDDGPHPEITPWILKELDKYQAKATFFCTGKNLSEYSDIARLIILKGHQLGNHTFAHENAWQTSRELFIRSIEKTQSLINDINSSAKYIFRPPYGKLSSILALKLSKKGYKIYLWTLMLGDFNAKIKPNVVLNKTIKKIKSGDIIVLHDNEKSFENLKKILPELLEILSRKGYRFEKF